jgi:hypothetical protein
MYIYCFNLKKRVKVPSKRYVIQRIQGIIRLSHKFRLRFAVKQLSFWQLHKEVFFTCLFIIEMRGINTSYFDFPLLDLLLLCDKIMLADRRRGVYLCSLTTTVTQPKMCCHRRLISKTVTFSFKS